MSAGCLLEEEIDAELLLSKLQGRGTASEHLNLSYLGLSDQMLARVAAVMRQSSAFANLKQIWLGSNQLSSIGDMQLPSCLTGIWLFSNRLNSHAALDVLLRLCRSCPEIQFVHMVRARNNLNPKPFSLLPHLIEQENNAFTPEDLAALLASRGYTNLPPQLVSSCRSNSVGDPGDYVQFVLFMRQVLFPNSAFMSPYSILLCACLSCTLRKQNVSTGCCLKHRASAPSLTAATSSHLSAALSSFQKYRSVPSPCQSCLCLHLTLVAGSLRIINFSCNGLSSGEISDICPSFQRMAVSNHARLQHLQYSSRYRLCTPSTSASTR